MLETTSVNDLVALLGVPIETLITFSGIVYLGVEWLKKKINVAGLGTQIVAFVISLGLAFHAIRPDTGGGWPQFFVLSVVVWLLPSGFADARKNGK